MLLLCQCVALEQAGLEPSKLPQKLKAHLLAKSPSPLSFVLEKNHRIDRPGGSGFIYFIYSLRAPCIIVMVLYINVSLCCFIILYQIIACAAGAVCAAQHFVASAVCAAQFLVSGAGLGLKPGYVGRYGKRHECMNAILSLSA